MEHVFTKAEIEKRFAEAEGKTLGEIDVKGDFDRTIENPKITGIAGDVVEHSILGYPSDTKQAPDIVVDGTPIEVKTTGVRGDYKKPETLSAKERITITNVSPSHIVNESFEDSKLWDKLNRTLLAYYLYDSPNVVPAAEYSNFRFLSHQWHVVSEADKKIIMNDWQIVRDFCASQEVIDKKNEEQAKAYSAAKKDMMYLETAPGWKNGPRFAIKKSFANQIIQEHFGQQGKALAKDVSSYAQLDQYLSEQAAKYKGMSLENIFEDLGVDKSLAKAKQAAHILISKVLNPNADVSQSEEQFDLVKKSGLVTKVFVIKQNGKKKEDCKFNYRIDFSEFNHHIGTTPEEEQKLNDVHRTDLYRYFSDTHFLFAIFKDGGEKGMADDVFLGFKRLTFSDDYLEENLVPVLNRLKQLIGHSEFKVFPKRGKDGQLFLNKNNKPMEDNNFPKSTEHPFFLRGTGKDSADKKLEINGYHWYYTQMWIQGNKLLEKLNEQKYL